MGALKPRRSWLFIVAAVFCVLQLSGCYSLPLNPHYKGPPERPLSIDNYYSHEQPVEEFSEEVIATTDDYTVHRYTLMTEYGPVKVDHYARPTQSDSLIFVFPVLGGKKNLIENYFADYFARNGFDTAIVHRNDDFKKPENFDRLESVMRESVIRDRLAIDFFENHRGKKRFGTFGLSRGAINVAITAGVDDRLKYNVMLLGGSDLVRVFKHTDQKRVRKFVKVMMNQKSMTEDDLYDYLTERIKTDPKYLARYIDSRHSLLFLSLFDQTVPIKSGFRLRQEIGEPETIVIFAGHYSSLLYTGIANNFLPDELPMYPVEYVETESIRFFRRSFNTGRSPFALLPLRIARLPFDLLGRLAHGLFEREHKEAPFEEWTPWERPMVQASLENMCKMQ